MRRPVVLWLAVAAAGVAVAGGVECPAAEGPVTCDTCPTGSDGNVMSKLPRVNRKASKVSSNWADYDLLSCDPASTSMCSVSVDTGSLMTQLSSGATKSSSLVNYVEGVVAYAAFGIVAALFAIVAALLYCCGRCCCCCCRGGCCGKRYPTYAMSAMRLGFTEVDAPLLSKGGVKELAYPGRSRWATRVCMLTYVGGVMAFISLGQLRGNQGITTSLHTIAESPASLMNLAVKAQAPLSSAAVAIASDLLYPLVVGINDTVMTSLDVPGLFADARCVTHGLRVNLPDMNALFKFVNDSVATIDTVKAATSSLQGNLGDIAGALTATLYHTHALRGNLTNLYGGIATVNASVAATGGDLSALDASLAALSSPSTGIGPAADGLAATRAHLPTQAAADDVNTGTNSLDTLTSGSTMVGHSAGATTARASLTTRLGALYTNLTGVPDLSALAYRLGNLSSTISNLRSSRLIDSLDAKLGSTAGALDALPTVAALNASLQAVRTVIRGISVAGIRSTLLVFKDTLENHIPNVTIVLVELDKVDRLTGVLGCVFHALQLVRAVNTTLLELPSMYNDAVSMVTDINDTVATGVAQVNGFRGQLNSLTNLSATLPNITHYIELVDVVAGQVANPPIDFSAIDAAMVSAAASRSGVDIPGMRASLVAFNTTLWSPSITPAPSTLTAMHAMAGVLGSVTAAVAGAVHDLALFSSGRCDITTGYIPCTPADGTANAACSGSPCTAAIRSCALDNSVSCAANSSCAGGANFCMYQAATFGAASTALSGYTSASPDTFAAELAPVAAAVASARAALAATPSLSGLAASISGAQDGLAAIPINSSLSLLATLEGQLSPDTVGIPAINSSVASVTSLVAGLDLSGIKSQVASVRDQMATVTDEIVPYLNRADTGIDTAERLLYVTLPAQLPRLSRPSLAAARAAGGLEGVVRQLVSVAQTLVDEGVRALNGTFDLSLNLTDTVEAYMPYIQRFTNANNTLYGPAYYFYNMLPGAKSVPPEEVAAAGGGTVFQSASGAVWSGSRMCVTTGCIGATIDKLNKEPLDIKPATFGSTGSGGLTFSLPVSREQIMFFPFLIPLAIALLGFCGAVGLCGKSWQSCPAAWSAFFICAVIPFIFLFAGALTFPFVMVMSDACRSALNVGYQFVAGSERALCNMLPNGTLVTTAAGAVCRTDVLNTTLEVQLARSYSALLGDCTTYPAVVSGIMGQVDSQLAPYAGRYINETLDSMTSVGGFDIKLRPRLNSVVRGVGINAAGVVHTVTTDVSTTFTCEVLNRAVTDISNSVCCSMMTSIYWFVSAWYFIAFFMCICGCPASIWGYKRFPNKLWGPDYALRSKASDGPQEDVPMLNADALAAAAGGDLVAPVADGGDAVTGGAAAPAPAPAPAPTSPPAPAPPSDPAPPSAAYGGVATTVVEVQPRVDAPGPGIEMAPLIPSPAHPSAFPPPGPPPMMPMYGAYDPMAPPPPGPMIMSPGGGWMPGMMPPQMLMPGSRMTMGPMGPVMLSPTGASRSPAYTLPPVHVGGGGSRVPTTDAPKPEDAAATSPPESNNTNNNP